MTQWITAWSFAAFAMMTSMVQAQNVTTTEEVFGGFTLVCVMPEGGAGECSLNQLLRDSEGNSVAEVSFVAITDDPNLVGGFTVATPLDTLLLAGLAFQLDGGEPASYPFRFCQPGGCFMQLGVTQAELDELTAAPSATVGIVPLAAPDEVVNLTLDMAGLAEGFAKMQENLGQ